MYRLMNVLPCVVTIYPQCIDRMLAKIKGPMATEVRAGDDTFAKQCRMTTFFAFCFVCRRHLSFGHFRWLGQLEKVILRRLFTFKRSKSPLLYLFSVLVCQTPSKRELPNRTFGVRLLFIFLTAVGDFIMDSSTMIVCAYVCVSMWRCGLLKYKQQ